MQKVGGEGEEEDRNSDFSPDDSHHYCVQMPAEGGSDKLKKKSSLPSIRSSKVAKRAAALPPTEQVLPSIPFLSLPPFPSWPLCSSFLTAFHQPRESGKDIEHRQEAIFNQFKIHTGKPEGFLTFASLTEPPPIVSVGVQPEVFSSHSGLDHAFPSPSADSGRGKKKGSGREQVSESAVEKKKKRGSFIKTASLKSSESKRRNAKADKEEGRKGKTKGGVSEPEDSIVGEKKKRKFTEMRAATMTPQTESLSTSAGIVMDRPSHEQVSFDLDGVTPNQKIESPLLLDDMPVNDEGSRGIVNGDFSPEGNKADGDIVEPLEDSSEKGHLGKVVTSVSVVSGSADAPSEIQRDKSSNSLLFDDAVDSPRLNLPPSPLLSSRTNSLMSYECMDDNPLEGKTSRLTASQAEMSSTDMSCYAPFTPSQKVAAKVFKIAFDFLVIFEVSF
jgi:hypothetical protein